MYDFDELFGRRDSRVIAVGPWVDHVLANVVLDHFRNKPIQGAAARGRLLQNVGALLARLDRALDGLDLTSQASDPIQKFGFFLADVTHAAGHLLL